MLHVSSTYYTILSYVKYYESIISMVTILKWDDERVKGQSKHVKSQTSEFQQKNHQTWEEQAYEYMIANHEQLFSLYQMMLNEYRRISD